LKVPDSTVHFRVRVLPHDRIIDAPAGHPLLAAILAAGLRAPHSCTMGYCGACRAGLRAGAIQYPSGQLVDADDGTARPDDIMLCIARARTDVEVEIRFAQGGLE